MNLEHLSKQRRAFVLKAKDAGYNITQHGNNEIFILKGKTCRSKGCMVFEDGKIMRNDTQLDLIKPMTIKEAETHLGI